MPSLDFPSTPNPGDTHRAANGIVYTWNGDAWVIDCPALVNRALDEYYELGVVEGDPSGSFAMPVDGRTRRFDAAYTFDVTLGAVPTPPDVAWAALIVPPGATISSWPVSLNWITSDGQPHSPDGVRQTKYLFHADPGGAVTVMVEVVDA